MAASYRSRHRCMSDSNGMKFESLEGRLLLAGDLDLRISEILTSNSTSLETRVREDADGRFRGDSFQPDWIEIQNTTDTPFDLSGHHLTDSRDVPKKWAFPDNTAVPPSSYLVVYASGLDLRDTVLDESGRLHTNFNLRAEGGDYLALTSRDGTVVHEFEGSLPQQFVDISYGLTSDDELGYFVTSTPGEPNGSTYDGIVSDTTFSIDRGFYDQPFEVSLQTETEQAEIRYTTDGSQPTATHGLVYASPIDISTTTNLRAAAFKPGYIPTNVDTHTYVLLDDVIQQPAEIEGFPFGGRMWAGQNTYVPQDSEMDPEIVSDPAYSGVIHDALRSIPTMSITSDPDQIFSDAGWYDGEDVEKAVSVEVIYADEPDRSHQAEAGIESHSHDRLKRSLRLNFRGIYGDSTFDTDLFQTAPLNGDTAVGDVKRIILRGGNNRSWARIWNPDKTAYTIDEFYRSTQIAMSGYGMRGNYVHLYINGVYWGLYNPVERADEFFTSAYFGGDSQDWFAVNHGGDLDGNDDRYDYLWRTLVRADMTQDENYEDLKQYLDVEGFSDYLIISWWMAVSDWPQNNWYGGNRNESSELGSDPFRYFAWDGEWSFGQGGASSPNGKAHVHSSFRSRSRAGDPIPRIWHAARQNSDFLITFADRVHRHLFNNGVLTEANAKQRWATLNDYVRDAVVAESARWGDAMESVRHPTRTRDRDWQREVDRVNGLMTGNTDVFIQALRREGYYPEIDPPVLAQHGGKVPDGFQLAIDNPNETGTVYVTTDGSDPRLAGGLVSDSATIVESGTALTLDGDLLLKSRVFDGTEWSALSEAAFSVVDETPLRITEVMYNPAPPSDAEVAAGFIDNDDFEFVEIQNTGAATIQLQDYRFNRGFDFEFPSGHLPAEGYIVVAKNVDAFRMRYGESPVVAGQFTRGSLSNGGEQLALQDPLGQTVLSLEYGDSGIWPARADGVGASLQVIDSMNLPIERAGKYYSWQASREFGGSPGGPGLAPVGVVINEVLTNTDGVAQLDSIELLNSSSVQIDLSGWYLSDSASELLSFRIPDGTKLGAGELLVFDESDFNGEDDPLGFALSSTRGDDVWLVISSDDGQVQSFVDDVHFPASRAGESLGRTDGWSYGLVPLTTPTLGSANSAPRVGPLVITEVHYSPGEPSAAALAVYQKLTSADLEFIEIHNTTETDVTMTDWRLRDGIDFDFPESFVLPAGRSVVLAPFNPDAAENESRAQAFRTQFAMDQDDLLVGGFRGRLSDDGEAIRLLRAQRPVGLPAETPRTVEDLVVYDNISPWPSVEANPEPQSIHRIKGAAFGSFADSWQASAPTAGRADLSTSLPGDFDNSGVVDVQDIDLLCTNIRANGDESVFDLNSDGRIDKQDLDQLVGEILGTAPGDANVDGVFDSSDLVRVFGAGQYEDAIDGNSGWGDGDWNCDGDFDSSDLVAAFRAGRFVAAAPAVNEIAAAMNALFEEENTKRRARLD